MEESFQRRDTGAGQRETLVLLQLPSMQGSQLTIKPAMRERPYGCKPVCFPSSSGEEAVSPRVGVIAPVCKRQPNDGIGRTRTGAA